MRIGGILIAMVCLMVASVRAEARINFERMEDGTARILILRGEFEFSDDPAGLVSEATAFRPTILTFHSGGGNVVSAMRYGRTIRALGLTTVQMRSSDCASACTLAFMGGVQRFAEPGSIGVHQSSFAASSTVDSQVAVSAVQSLTANIMTYMGEMGVDPQLLSLSLSIDASDMRYLTASEMRQYRVTTDGVGASASVRTAAVEPAPQPVQEAGSTVSREAKALDFIRRYHAAWSSLDGSAAAFIRSAYADPVQYFGKLTPLSAVLREKQAFIKRWPIRAYSVREGTERVNCQTTCRLEAVVDWAAKSEERGKSAQGAATIAVEWDPQSERILSESSKVLKAQRSSASASEMIAQWRRENDQCRGGSGDQAETLAACDRREAISKMLDHLNWCYGKQGEYGYQHRWHVCGPTSVR